MRIYYLINIGDLAGKRYGQTLGTELPRNGTNIISLAFLNINNNKIVKKINKIRIKI